jgi:hypothetical protein
MYLISAHHCVNVTKYKVDNASEHLLDFTFCEVEKDRGVLATNKPCESDISIN